jgi:hypothetical protein
MPHRLADRILPLIYKVPPRDRTVYIYVLLEFQSTMGFMVAGLRVYHYV